MFYNYLISEKILELLEAIHSKYTDYFTRENVKQEFNTITNAIHLFLMDTTMIHSKIEHKKKKYKNKILIKKKPIKKKIYPNLERCHARIWGTIHIKGDTTNYGSQCCKKKQCDSQYCFIHTKKLSHGNYFKEPIEVIKNHFKKGYKKG